MKTVLLYLLQVIISSGILYGYYHLFLRNKKFHQYNRYYLLMATAISICIPFLRIPVYFAAAETEPILVKTLTIFSSDGFEEDIVAGKTSVEPDWFIWKNILSSIYVMLAIFLFTRFCIALIRIARLVHIYPNEEIDNIRFINTDDPATPFSFFRWLFWNNKIEINSYDGQQIFRHELFHIQQKHSRDIIFIELLTIIFWLNPFFHLIKKELKAIHEFLADRFAANENNKWEYAELLLMHALKTKQHLVNPFFHNQIKRRIAMITTSKKPGYQYFRKVLIIPIVALLFVLFAFQIKKSEDPILPSANAPITVTIGPTRDTVPKTISSIKPEQIKEIQIKNELIIIKLKTGENILATQNQFLKEQKESSQKQEDVAKMLELKKQDAHIAAQKQMQAMELKYREAQMAAQKELQMMELKHREAVVAAEKEMQRTESQYQEAQINAEKELIRMRELKQQEPIKAMEKEMQIQQLKHREVQMAVQKEVQTLELKHQEVRLAVQKELQTVESKFAESQIAVEKELIMKIESIQREAQKQQNK